MFLKLKKDIANLFDLKDKYVINKIDLYLKNKKMPFNNL